MLSLLFTKNTFGQNLDLSKSIINKSVVFEDKNGTVVVEAEHFTSQSMTDIRKWYISSHKHKPNIKPDPDTVMVTDASGGAYVEVLPDEFVTKEDKAIEGVNLALIPGSLAVLEYKIYFNEPGRYYVWSRMRSNDDEDNTHHVGINGTWPLTGKILQFPKLQKKWFWNNKIRNSVPAPEGDGILAFVEVPTVGFHTIMFSMREDGEEFDKFILTKDKNYQKPEGAGPAVTLKKGKLPTF
ncbi:MAG: hypothetical protein KA313_09040 [Pseudarcicella sp.]|nr:hypothetical protein [Pseudarcicella sp.]MBP6411230.1 hypothetical protein [Pseudarcicella sp.]